MPQSLFDIFSYLSPSASADPLQRPRRADRSLSTSPLVNMVSGRQAQLPPAVPPFMQAPRPPFPGNNHRNVQRFEQDVARIQGGLSALRTLPFPAILPLAVANRAQDFGQQLEDLGNMQLGLAQANSPNRAALMREHVAGGLQPPVSSGNERIGRQTAQEAIGAINAIRPAVTSPLPVPTPVSPTASATGAGTQQTTPLPPHNVDVYSGGMMERTAYPSLGNDRFGPGTRAAPVAGTPPANFASLMATPPATQWVGGQAMTPLEQATMASMRSDPMGAAPNSTWMRGGDLSPEQLVSGAAMSFDPRTRFAGRAEMGLNTRAAGERDANNAQTRGALIKTFLDAGIDADSAAQMADRAMQKTPLPPTGQRQGPEGWVREPQRTRDAQGNLVENPAAGWWRPQGYDVNREIITPLNANAYNWASTNLMRLHRAVPKLIEENWPAIERILRTKIDNFDQWLQNGPLFMGGRAGGDQDVRNLISRLSATHRDPMNQSMPSVPATGAASGTSSGGNDIVRWLNPMGWGRQ